MTGSRRSRSLQVLPREADDDPTLPVVGLTGVQHVGAGALRGEGNAEGAPAPVLVLSRKG